MKILKIVGLVFLAAAIVLMVVWMFNIEGFIVVGIVGNCCLAVGVVIVLVVTHIKNKALKNQNQKPTEAVATTDETKE